MSDAGIIGPIVGPISDRREGGIGGSEYSIVDFPYDYAIGGIPFKTFVTPTTPYQRITADFRKQQFDASQNAGDQSLTGFWLRGQFSFHTGAGIRFNDAFNDATTANRFFDGVGVDPWTPGEVSMSGSWVDETRHGNSDYMLGGWDGFDPVIYYVSATDAKLYSTASASTPISTNTCGSFAPDPNPGGSVFYLDANHVIGDGYDSDQSDGYNFSGLWWVHGRLLAVDEHGNWYTLPVLGTGISVAVADAFWPGDGFSGPWAVTDSPGAIYMGRGRTIYRATISTDGDVPVLVAPAVAAELPDDETITALAYYLSFLVIVTNKGVRIGLTDTGGDVQYGARLVDFVSSTCQTIAARGSRVYCSGTRDTDSQEQVVVIDLSESTGDGLFAYTIDTPPPWAGDAHTGLVYSEDQVWSYSDTTFQSLGALEPSATATLETGYIRMGTMEPKAFHSARIKLTGSEGSVSVSVVRRNGIATLLTNLAASTLGDYEIDLEMTGPEEYIALRFTLIAGPTGGSPTLLGYQVRALPAPAVRPRLISVPLGCYDMERAANGLVNGHDGWAWERLSALEDMERDAGLVVFQDFRTGEQGLAFIEQVSFSGELPASGTQTGFGGVITATLRKVA